MGVESSRKADRTFRANMWYPITAGHPARLNFISKHAMRVTVGPTYISHAKKIADLKWVVRNPKPIGISLISTGQVAR